MKRAIAGVASAVGMCVALTASHPSRPEAAASTPACRDVQGRAVVPASSDVYRARVTSSPLSHYDARVQASFVSRFDAQRRAQLVVRSNNLDVEKTVAPDGSFTITLTAPDDRVVVSMQQAGVDVSRGGRALHLEFGQSIDDDYLAVQRLLGGSRAVRLHHVMTANLDAKTPTTPGGAATLLTDVFLAFLGGDVAAVERFGRDLIRRRQPSSSLVRVRVGGEDGPESCYVRWENEVMAAWYQMVACKVDYAPFNPLQEICNLRYYMRTECAWFELLSCCAIPIRAE